MSVIRSDEPNQTDEQVLVSVRGIKIKMRGRALLVLALGISAAMGAVVVLEDSGLLRAQPAGSASPWGGGATRIAPEPLRGGDFILNDGAQFPPSA